MADFNFPPSPIPNQEHIEGGTTYIWNGYGWAIKVEESSGGGSVPAESAVALAYSGLQVNGSVDIDNANQGALVTLGASVPGAYSAECWRIDKGGTIELTIQRVPSVFPGYAHALKVAITVAQAMLTTETVDISHMIEGHRIAKLGWGTAVAKPLTIGFWAKSSIAGTFPVYATGDGTPQTANVTITTPNVAQWVTVTFPAVTTGPAWALGNTLGIRLIFRIAAAGALNIADTVGNTFEITGLVVLPGLLLPTAAQAPLMMRSADQELNLCRRYWRKLPQVNISGYGGAGNGVILFLPLDPPMRVAPTVTFANPGEVNAAPLSVSTSYDEAVCFTTIPVAQGGFYAFADALCDSRL